jgi:hypothetical protein
VQPVFEVGHRAPVLLAAEIEIRVGIQLEGLAAQAKIGFVHGIEPSVHQKVNPLLFAGLIGVCKQAKPAFKPCKETTKNQPDLALPFLQKRVGFAHPFLLSEPAKSRFLLFDAS